MSVKRVVLPLSVSVAVVPWLLAAGTTMLWELAAGQDQPGSLFGTRMVLVPLLLVGEVAAVVAVFRRYGGLRADFWPGAGLAFALLALFTVMGVSSTAGARGFLLWIWALYSGYVFFVFGLGGRAWKKAFAQPGGVGRRALP
ncbi:hypothetical protein, partial [Streptomyces sp. NPDC089915]|uniref:hypothetical protein n=1 Tax=Streptomyces sp. NPDC089915 TaxID=3155186 RepID=UPI003446E3B2